MKHISQKIGLLVLMALVFNACSKKDSSPNSDLILGKWFLQTVSTSVTFKNDTPENSTEDLSDSGLYFDFASDGTYTTNSEIELGDVQSGDGTLSSGSYTYKSGVLGLTYNDPDLGIPVTLYLDAAVSGTNLSLSLDKDDLFDSLTNGSEDLDPFTLAFIQLFLDEILTFDFTMTLTK